MSVFRGDFVRPNNPGPGLPQGSVWRVVCTAGALKLEPENDAARSAHDVVRGCRFSPRNFDKVVLCRGKWVGVRDADFLRAPASFYDDVLPVRMASSFPSPQNLPKFPFSSADAGTTATGNAEQALSTAVAIDHMRVVVRQLKSQQQEELRAAKAAKAKADKEAAARAKEAAARAKVDEARKALAAKLHADRCLGEATLALIAEVSRLNNGGAERPADTSIATHCDQLQALARSYGYRIVKPSMIALVVKL